MSYMARKKNRVLQIAEEKAEEYAKMGYEITDENGRVVLRAELTTLADARELLADAQKTIAEAQKYIKELSQVNESLNTKLSESEEKVINLQKELSELKASTAVKPASKTAKKAE